LIGTFLRDIEPPTAKKNQSSGIADPVRFAREWLHFDPDERQAAVLRSTARRGILNCTRQWGKSTVTAAKAVHRAYTRPGSLVLVASPTDRQSAEFMRKAAEFTRQLQIAPRGDGDNKISILFPNGSRIVGLPGKEETVRGFSSVSMLLIDEAAVVPDELYRTLRPMLAVNNGDLWLMSTPRRKHGFFYQAWTHGGPEWERVRVPATECGRIPKEFLEEERRELDTRAFRREYMTEFEDGGVGVFDRDLIERALDGSVSPLEFQGTW
jgi:hypothetical protein